jgi:hypothetical protein
MAYNIQPNTIIIAKVHPWAQRQVGAKTQVIKGTFEQWAEQFGQGIAERRMVPFDILDRDLRIQVNGVAHKPSFRVTIPGTTDVRVLYVAIGEYWENKRK